VESIGRSPNLDRYKEISRRLADGREFAVCYLDINDFKPYNDRYGFAAGDRIIQQLAELVQQNLARLRDGFAGHVVAAVEK